MAIKYECDTCHQVTDPADTYGQGVVPDGKGFVWMPKTRILPCPGLKVVPFIADEPSHTCGRCLGLALREMVNQIWPVSTPEDSDDDTPRSDSSDSDVREVRPEPEVQRTGPDVYTSPGTGPGAPNHSRGRQVQDVKACTCTWEGTERVWTETDCPQHGFHSSG